MSGLGVSRTHCWLGHWWIGTSAVLPMYAACGWLSTWKSSLFLGGFLQGCACYRDQTSGFEFRVVRWPRSYECVVLTCSNIFDLCNFQILVSKMKADPQVSAPVDELLFQNMLLWSRVLINLWKISLKHCQLIFPCFKSEHRKFTAHEGVYVEVWVCGAEWHAMPRVKRLWPLQIKSVPVLDLCPTTSFTAGCDNRHIVCVPQGTYEVLPAKKSVLVFCWGRGSTHPLFCAADAICLRGTKFNWPINARFSGSVYLPTTKL